MTTVFKVGDQVNLLHLKRKGIVLAVSSKNSIKVRVGDFQMYCKPAELEFVGSPRQEPQTANRKISFQKSKLKKPISLDLHGYNSESAKEALLTFISDSVIAGHQQVSIIHGHGSGIIKKLVHKILSELEMVASFRHPMGTTAETKVYFR